MTLALRAPAGEQPRTARASRTAMLTGLRPAARAVVHRRWQVEVHGAAHVPAHGPVVMAANHVGWLDGPLLAIVSPRPAHVLTKQEMYAGPMGAFLHAAGQIPLDRWQVDLGAVRQALRVLEEGRVVGVFPEGARGDGSMRLHRPGAAYLALVSGAPVVPVAFLGTRLPGAPDDSVPPAGSRIAVTYGEPLHLPHLPWPRTHDEVTDASARVREAVVTTLRAAETATGMTLPGPLGPARTQTGTKTSTTKRTKKMRT
ncbi:MAG: glycerol acyltransferase [Marmoricola sp.]|nr:glycerol acyltransferase [Marmoricola sp.]